MTDLDKRKPIDPALVLEEAHAAYCAASIALHGNYGRTA